MLSGKRRKLTLSYRWVDLTRKDLIKLLLPLGKSKKILEMESKSSFYGSRYLSSIGWLVDWSIYLLLNIYFVSPILFMPFTSLLLFNPRVKSEFDFSPLVAGPVSILCRFFPISSFQLPFTFCSIFPHFAAFCVRFFCDNFSGFCFGFPFSGFFPWLASAFVW